MQSHPVLQGLIHAGMRLGLKRSTALLQQLGDPQRCAPAIHIAGTNGKGSTLAFCESICRHAGVLTGSTTSPHLQSLNERIRVGGEPIEDASLDQLLQEISERSTRWWREAYPEDESDRVALTYFEALTTASFLYGARRGVELMLVEVGLGGRLDATNCVDPAVTLVTSIGLDHQAQLGPDHASIAAEKGGIFREGVPVVLGRLPSDAARVLRAMAQQLGCPLYTLGEEFDLRWDEARGGWIWEGMGRKLTPVRISLPGEHQRDNAALAVAALLLWSSTTAGRPLSDAQLLSGLADTRHPGRCEWISPDLLLDGAHNAPGAHALASYLSQLPREQPRTLLLGCSTDKDTRSIVMPLTSQVDRVLLTRCAHPRAADPVELAQDLVGLNLPVLPAGSIEEALPQAQALEGLVIVAGSLYLTGAVRELCGL